MTTTATVPPAAAGKRSRFTQATREQSKLKAALAGPPSGGKSFTALRLATLMKAAGLANNIGVIETEGGKIKKYVGCAPDGIPFQFALSVLTTYSPLEYIAAIEDACNSGIDLIIIDGLSPAWAGKEGVLETVDAVGGNSKFTSGWKIGSPMQNKLIDIILQCPAHVIATLRCKVDYVLQDKVKDNGQIVKEPKKIGLAPIQRDGIEYEFEIVGFFDASHVMTVTKTICEPLDNAVFVKPGPDFAAPIIEWLKTGEVASAPKIVMGSMAGEQQVRDIMEVIAASRRKVNDEKEQLLKLYGVREFHQLSYDQAEKYLSRLRAFARSAATQANGQQQAAPTAATQETAAGPAAAPAAPTTSPVTPQPAQPQNGNGRDADASWPMTDEQHRRVDELVAQVGLKPADVRKLVREVGCKQGAVKKLTAQQATDMASRLTGQLVGGTPATAGGQTLQEALAAGQAAGNAAMAEPAAAGSNGAAAPNAYSGLDANPVQFIATAWEELALLAGWTKDASNASFAAALARRNVNSLRDMTAEQLAEFKANLVAKITAIYKERGDVAACPFPIE